MAVCANNGRAL